MASTSLEPQLDRPLAEYAARTYMEAKLAAERRSRALEVAFDTTVALSRLAWDGVAADDLRVHRAIAALRGANLAAGFADVSDRRRRDYRHMLEDRNEGRDVLPVPSWKDE
jgi:hypothetical protein